MHDKVLNIIRETLLHENTVELFTYDFRQSVVRLDLKQPREEGEYPDYNLRLTFVGVTDFSGSGLPGLQATGLLGIECHHSPGGYQATITMGDSGKPPKNTVRLVRVDSD